MIAKPARVTRRRQSAWSIAIYEGESPLSLAPAPGIRNPVLTDEEVTDVPADFVADPFMIRQRDQWWMFCEVFSGASARGEIGLAASKDGYTWRYEGIVLAEPVHLSYPYVFRAGDEYYMIPETYGFGGIDLYRAAQFPRGWRRAARLLQGTFADTSIFYHDERWWMFSCTNPAAHDTLRLYHSRHLMGPWEEHARSPIVAGDRTRARPGGRVTEWNGSWLRFAQDCKPTYGTRVRAFQIDELTTTTYREHEVAESPILNPGEIWNRTGMHHVDPHLLPGGRWLACVDGYYMREPEA